MRRAILLATLCVVSPAAAAPADSVVVARIVQTSPIGDGKCAQRSYEVEVDKHERGPAPGKKLWVHFEHCAGAPPPADLAGTGMKIGTAYRLTLRPGASKNFGRGFMIVAARAP